MADPRYPNETPEYRQARDALLEEEIKLIERVKAIAAQRRTLPPGGELKEDYEFIGATEATLEKPIRFSDLFGDKQTLLLYSYMFGPDWDNPCPSCTSIIDGFDRAARSVTFTTAFAVVAKATPAQINEWAHRRGWSDIPLVSAGQSDFLVDYKAEDPEDGKLWPVLHTFTKQDGAIRHFYSTEMSGNSIDTVWPYWNLMDYTPEGRPDRTSPPQDFRSEYIEKHYLADE